MMEQISTQTELGSLYRTLLWTWLPSQGTCKAKILRMIPCRIYRVLMHGIDSYVRKQAAVKRITPIPAGRVWKKTSYRAGIHNLLAAMHACSQTSATALLGPPSRPFLCKRGCARSFSPLELKEDLLPRKRATLVAARSWLLDLPRIPKENLSV